MKITQHPNLFLKATALLFLLLFFAIGHCLAAQQAPRFFLMGTGVLHLSNLRNNREARVQLLNRDGSFNEPAFDEVDRVFGFPTAEKGEHISPRMLFMLSYFSDLVAPGRTINIESAYRSPEYNGQIRANGANAARTSTHMDGMALDFWLEGVDGKELWETIRAKNCCGVGHYGGKIIHFDAGRPRFWQAATSGTGSREPDYNRHLYLATGFDRYRPEETMQLSFSGISTFGFGVRPTVHLVPPGNTELPGTPMQLDGADRSGCIRINDRRASRFLAASLPSDLPAGRYRVKMQFCQRPFPEMPAEAVSNEIELYR